MAVATSGGNCFPASWLCDGRSLLVQILMGLALLPLVVGIPIGLHAGICQVLQTYRMLAQLQKLPYTDLPPCVKPLAHVLHLTDKLDIVRDTQPEAFCYGLINPRICLTTGLVATLTPQEMDAVLRHERHHLQRHDPLRALLWTMLDSTWWWQEHRGEQAQLQRELAADRAVITAGGRQPLASALLKFLSYPEGNSRGSDGLAISGLSVTEARIEQLLHTERQVVAVTPWNEGRIVPVITTLLLLLCTVVMAR